MTLTAAALRLSRDQRRARHAWKAVQRAKGGPREKEFGQQARNLSLRIRAAGLGQALEYLDVQEGTADLMRELCDWVLDKCDNPQSTEAQPKSRQLIDEIKQRNAAFLRRATAEALAYLQWLSRFAVAAGLTE